MSDLTLWPEPDPGTVDEIEPRTLDAALEEARWIAAASFAEHAPRRTFVLFSGGDDSLVLLDVVRRLGLAPDGVVHVNTGTGIKETTDFVRATCAGWALELHELHPPESFEELFVERGIIDGLPGPGMHHIAYDRLKGRALRAFVQANKRPRPIGWRDRVMFLTGIRADESRKRMGYTDTIVDRDGAAVWVNPLFTWTNDEVRAYRLGRALPRNPVAEHLHLSGECLCGSYASPGEREAIAFFFPAQEERFCAWEARCEELGRTYSKWGIKRPSTKRRKRSEGHDHPGRLCSSCPPELPLFGDGS